MHIMRDNCSSVHYAHFHEYVSKGGGGNLVGSLCIINSLLSMVTGQFKAPVF
jgi:hypothetical protein